MYITKIIENESNGNFDWTKYFSREENFDIFEKFDKNKILNDIRYHLQENNFKMLFVLSQVMRSLLRGLDVKKPNILELGAATGFLTRWLVTQYDGRGTLVDRNEASYKAFNSLKDTSKEYIQYLVKDIFELELEEKFDIVCSFGLIEHFEDKSEVLEVHKRYLSEDGLLIIVVPMDSLLTRVFFEVHPELNLGYRELLTEGELKKILNDADLEVLKTEISIGYAYDHVAAVCKKR